MLLLRCMALGVEANGDGGVSTSVDASANGEKILPIYY